MAKFCTECGKEIKNGAAFCTECGRKAPADQIETREAFVPTPSSQNYRTYQQVNVAPQNPTDVSGDAVSTGKFFGLMLLFAIPVVGIIACISMCFTQKNKNLRNYARANVIWAIIGLAIGVLLICGIIAVGNTLIDIIKEAMDGEYSGVGALFKQFQNFGFTSL